MKPIPVHFVLLPGSLLLDWAGPAEAFRIANQSLQARGAAPRFDVHFIGPAASPRSSLGIAVTGVAPLPAELPPGSWVVLVGMPGNAVDRHQPGMPETLQWLRALPRGERSPRIVTICAVPQVLARLGAA